VKIGSKFKLSFHHPVEFSYITIGNFNASILHGKFLVRNQKPGLFEWLHCKREVDYSQAQWLGAVLGLILFCTAIILFITSLLSVLYFFGAFIGLGPFANDPTGTAIRNIGLVLAALFGAPLLIWRSIVAQKQVNVAEQGQITDRINKAVEGLGSEKTVREITEIPRYQKNKNEWVRDDNGNPKPALRPDGIAIIDRNSYERTSPNLEVRIGAIYALERIAQDSDRDHIQIMEILCAYIRENAPLESLEPTEPPFKKPVPRTYIQVAITIIGRRSNRQIELEWQQEFRLDFRNTDLSGIDFQNGDFSAAMFHKSRLEMAYFKKCKLIGAQFHWALLNFADFFNAELRGTVFDYAIINMLNEPNEFSINMGNIYGISVAAADITAIDYLGEPDEMNLVFGSKDTKLCDHLEFDRDKFKQPLIDILKLKRVGEVEKANDLESDLYKNGFVDWFPHSIDDRAFGRIYHKFLDKLDLHGWPYR